MRSSLYAPFTDAAVALATTATAVYLTATSTAPSVLVRLLAVLLLLLAAGLHLSRRSTPSENVPTALSCLATSLAALCAVISIATTVSWLAWAATVALVVGLALLLTGITRSDRTSLPPEEAATGQDETPKVLMTGEIPAVTAPSVASADEDDTFPGGDAA